MDVKYRLYNVALENWQTLQMPSGKKIVKTSLQPEIISLCKVMINGSMVLNSDYLENLY